MQTKTFRADSTLETLQLVQTELGADAIVVSMREVPIGPLWDPWKKSTIEIVAASAASGPSPVAPKAKQELRPVAGANHLEVKEEMPEIEWDLPSENHLAHLRAKPHPRLKLNLESEANVPSAPIMPPATQALVPGSPASDVYIHPALKRIRQQLTSQGVDAQLVERLTSLALETLSPATLGDYEKCRKAIVELMAAELRVRQGAGEYLIGNVFCIIGASGSGKTSTMAKLALFLGQRTGKRITWVCADTLGTGAVAEARAYTDALGLTLKLVYLPDDLRELLRNIQGEDILLIDTPGYNPCNESQMIELGSLLAEAPRRCTYLVAPATCKEADLLQLSASLGIFSPDGLIISKLDETHGFGNVYNFARQAGIPVAYFATGKDAARDFEPADPVRLIAALFGKEWNR